MHPKTGRICIPIPIEECETFDPFAVPTVRSLCEEIDRYGKRDATEEGVSDMQKTSLWNVVEKFEKTYLKDLYKTLR